MNTFFVTIFRRWVSRKGSGRWTTGLLVSEEKPLKADHDINLFEVAVPTQSEAIPVLMEWLARGRPRDMTVREVR